jgi:hypothetical protein
MNDKERDAKLDFYASLLNEDMISLTDARKAIGSASSLYRPGKRFWNWFFDTEYTSFGLMPAVWIIPLVLFLALLGVTIAASVIAAI